MASTLAELVRKRFTIVSFFLFCGFVLHAYYLYETDRGFDGEPVEPFAAPSFLFSTVFHFVNFIFALTLAANWNLQFKLSPRFRPGMVIKYVFWLNGLLTVFSGIAAYLFIFEFRTGIIWFPIVLFAADLIPLLVSMSVRYAIEEDVKKRKVCEFC